MDVKKKKFVSDDGRAVERIIHFKENSEGESQRVTEVFVEPKPEKKLSHRVVEYTKPVVQKREIEVIDDESGETKVVEYTKPVVVRREEEVFDQNGEIVEKRVDNIALREREVTRKGNMKPLNLYEDMKEEDKRHEKYATKQDLNESIIMLTGLVQDMREEKRLELKKKRKPVQPIQQTYAPQPMHMANDPMHIANQSVHAFMDERIQNKKKLSVGDYILWGIIIAQVLVLAYLVAFVM